MESSRIASLPPSIFYIPDFITEQEEAFVLQKIPSNRWITLTHRRLQAQPSRLTATNTLISSVSLPSWLSNPIVERIHKLGIFAEAPHGINHCLINEYLPGQGIMAHEDGAAYFPAVATVSLGGTLVLNVTEKTQSHDDSVHGQDGPKQWRVLQEPRSLLITTGSAYTDTLHGIAEVSEDTDLNSNTVANWELLGDRELIEANEGVNQRSTRISLTYRDVKKVASIGSKLFGKPKT